MNSAVIELLVFAIVVTTTMAAARFLFRQTPPVPTASEPAVAPVVLPAQADLANVVASGAELPTGLNPAASAIPQSDSDIAIPPVESSPELQSDKARDELEAFIDEVIKTAMEHDNAPTVFMRMRQEHGTQEAISRLLRSGDVQSGFKRLSELSLVDCSIEAAVLKFPDRFDRHDQACAQFRIAQARRQISSPRAGNT